MGKGTLNDWLKGDLVDDGGKQALVLSVKTVDASGNAIGSSSSPVYIQQPPSGTSPVTGTFTGTGVSALFTAMPGHAIWVKLSGTFVGSVRVERCSDGTAASAQSLTVVGTAFAVFTTPAQEAVSAEDDPGVAYRLNCTAYTSGTVTYSIGHK